MEGDERKAIDVSKPIAPVGGSGFSTKEVNKLKELMEKFPQLEDAINKLLK